MELAFCAFASRLATLSSELIDRPFDNRLIREERLDNFSELVGEINERLAKLGELLSFGFILYAQYINSIQISTENATKN